ncbi:hypothetical protein CDAR_494011 [Caerostris darwini]|uniref:Uncharacterized protein n=1 Tax=Caerostris darwini TaxID=1538125 RepID=A0AAV4VU41_9ARAC|nr:hypothetical protein CDAR_494011 [Caerostris darwini]
MLQEECAAPVHGGAQELYGGTWQHGVARLRSRWIPRPQHPLEEAHLHRYRKQLIIILQEWPKSIAI